MHIWLLIKISLSPGLSYSPLYNHINKIVLPFFFMYLFLTALCGCVAVLCTATGQPVSWIDHSIFTVLEPITWLCHRGARCYGNTSCSVLLDAVGGLQRASAWFLLPIWSSLTCAASKAKMSLFLF